MSMKSCELIMKQLLPPVREACRLVPELTLSVLTSSNPLWHIPYEDAMKKLDRKDPWWAFLWPGSQALSRYILDNAHLVKNRRILDVGCGCGASSIAAKLSGGRHVIANDIDLDALTATAFNGRLNDVTIDEYSSENVLFNFSSFIRRNPVDWIIIGDMCYEDELTRQILNLINTAHRCDVRVLLADPGRHSFRTMLVNELKQRMKPIIEYPIVDKDYIEVDFKSIQVWSS